MERGPLLFLLGAGASADSGLPTYRGANGLYANDVDTSALPISAAALCSGGDDAMRAMWRFLAPLYACIAEHAPGPTYATIQRLVDAAGAPCHVVTQNIDGYARSLTGLHGLTELHGYWGTMSCVVCEASVPSDPEHARHSEGHWYRPDIVLYGECVPETTTVSFSRFVHKAHPRYIIVIGTTLEFPYLRRRIINKAKSRGAKVIHVNPEEPRTMGRGEQWVASVGELEALFLK